MRRSVFLVTAVLPAFLLLRGGTIVRDAVSSVSDGTPATPTVVSEERAGDVTRFVFSADVDGMSFGMPDATATAQIRGWNGAQWTPWEPLAVETEFDPLLTESNLVLLPEGTRSVEVRSPVALVPHPIAVSHDPPVYAVASHFLTRRPRILARSEWGANESFLVRGPDTSHSDVASSGDDKEQIASSASVKRVVDCLQLQRDYPQEFRTFNTIRTTPDGQKLRWPIQYSPAIKLLVVHHTAMTVRDDPRPAVERIRALYAYHANSRGWGDIGYNFVIDEAGQIYEGRAGGSDVVAGHAYCNNIGTLGVALLGNFELEQPTQDQVSALQWLLHSLAASNAIDLTQDVEYHGRMLPPIIGHRDVVSTSCPGYYMYEVIEQVRRNVREGKITAHVTFPSLIRTYVDRAEERRTQRLASLPETPPDRSSGLSARGSTLLQGRPGTQLVLSVQFEPGGTPHSKGERIADVTVPDGSILWQETADGSFARVRTSLELPAPLSSRATALLRLKLQLPPQEGRATLRIGNLTYILETSGRRLRTAAASSAASDLPASSARTRLRLPVRSSSSSSSSSRPRLLRTTPPVADDGPDLRIRLTHPGDRANVEVPPQTRMNGAGVSSGIVALRMDGDDCLATVSGQDVARGIVRIDTGMNGTFTLTTSPKATNRFRGILECRIVDGSLALINELPLEQYLRGLAEEPDTEPYQKQRTFAIAARSYAAYYREATGGNRKFPGKPYDGSDDPAVFQAYGGVVFEERNPRWLSAVDSTHLQVLTVDGAVIKVPYFSQSDGRTLSPADAGWPNFPHAEIFSAKPDPWCVGMQRRGHGVGMSGCGAEAQAKEGKTAEQILGYYYPGTAITVLRQ